MNRTGIFRVCIAFIAIIGLGLAACGDGDGGGSSDGGHTHSWGDWVLNTSFGVDTRTCSCGAADKKLTLDIGATGEAGGVIFYRNTKGFTLLDIDPAKNKTVYYLEAWTANESTSIWGDSGMLVGGDITTFTDSSFPQASIIGNGRRDTQLIVAHMVGRSITETAAQRCANKTVTVESTTFNDWFLPSLGELNELYKAKGQTSVPDSGSYWSSSQSNANFAWRLNFAEGDKPADLKFAGINVRAVRAF